MAAATAALPPRHQWAAMAPPTTLPARLRLAASPTANADRDATNVTVTGAELDLNIVLTQPSSATSASKGTAPSTNLAAGQVMTISGLTQRVAELEAAFASFASQETRLRRALAMTAFAALAAIAALLFAL